MARCQLNDVCRMRLIYNQTGFAKLFDNQQNLIVVIIVIHLARSLEQSQMIQFCWDLNGSILLSFSIIIRDKSILLFILVPTFYPIPMALLYSYTCIPYYSLPDYSGYDCAGEHLSSAECSCKSVTIRILSLGNEN